MTCIVGVVYKNIIYMGGDSCGSNGHTWGSYGETKVFKVDKFLIGCTTSFRIIDLLRYNLSVKRSHPDDSDDKFLRTTFVDAVRACFIEGGYAKKDDPDSGGKFIIGYNGSLYSMQSDYSVLNPPEWGYAVGSGDEAARGSLWTTRDNNDPKERVMLALQAAEAVVTTVRRPMYILEM